jgi:hypothetical protein
MARIYVASSWRNQYQPHVIKLLRELGHDPYDFRNPRGFEAGFQWEDVDPNWQQWCMEQYRDLLDTRKARRGFDCDMMALQTSDTCLLVLPCGRSAHLEAGYASGNHTNTAVYIPEPIEPELMYKMFGRILLDHKELVAWATELPR